MKLFSILNDIEFKGNKANILLKWVIGIAASAVVGAFIVGQLKMRHLDKLDDIEKLAKEGVSKTEQLEKRIEDGFKEQNIKIDKIYDDGIDAFNEYREFNNEQMKLIIDYGHENKELLKKMLDINSKERAIQIENDLKKSKKEISNTNQKSQDLKNRVLIEPNIVVFTEVATGTNHYHIFSAPENYLDTLDLKKYKILEKNESEKYDGLFNFHYVDKK